MRTFQIGLTKHGDTTATGVDRGIRHFWISNMCNTTNQELSEEMANICCHLVRYVPAFPQGLGGQLPKQACQGPASSGGAPPDQPPSKLKPPPPLTPPPTYEFQPPSSPTPGQGQPLAPDSPIGTAAKASLQRFAPVLPSASGTVDLEMQSPGLAIGSQDGTQNLTAPDTNWMFFTWKIMEACSHHGLFEAKRGLCGHLGSREVLFEPGTRCLWRDFFCYHRRDVFSCNRRPFYCYNRGNLPQMIFL